MKLFAGGVTTPKILAYDIQKEAYGVLLKPACAIHLPEMQEGWGMEGGRCRQRALKSIL